MAVAGDVNQTGYRGDDEDASSGVGVVRLCDDLVKSLLAACPAAVFSTSVATVALY